MVFVRMYLMKNTPKFLRNPLRNFKIVVKIKKYVKFLKMQISSKSLNSNVKLKSPQLWDYYEYNI